MKEENRFNWITAWLIAMFLLTGCAEEKEPPKMKMTTDIPTGITTPDDLETRLGTLNSSTECRIKRPERKCITTWISNMLSRPS